MLSPNMTQELDRLYELQTSYKPDSEIAAQLGSKTILLFVGATCVGKNTIMDGLASRDGRFQVVGTFTSREPRTEDKAYTYFENSDLGLRSILEAIEQRQVVQYAVHPFAHTLYGSQLQDYSGDFPMADIFSGAVGQFKQLGFKQTEVITIVTEPNAWLRRFEERFPYGNPQRQARRDEAIESLKWSLAQPSEGYAWVINIDNELDAALEQTMDAATGKHQDDSKARGLARAMIQTAEGVRI